MLAYALVAVQVLGINIVFNAFVPDFDTGFGSRLLAANLSIYSSPTAIRSIPFGRVGIAGQILFRENISNTGDEPDELLLIVGLAGYPATSLEKFWFNETLVFNGDSTTGPGAITAGKFMDDLWVWFRTGEETSDAFPEIAALSTKWNAKTRILRGIPSIGIRVKVTEIVEGRLQPLAQIKGGKWYDPRLDSTVPGGSGTHRIDDPSTWEFTVNSKLCELAYLVGGSVNGTRIFGMGKGAPAIDLENFASEANICEEQINVVGGGAIDRYTTNGILIPSSNHKRNLQRLLSASAGTMDASGGIYRTFAGAWRASSMTLTESDIDGAPSEMLLQIDQSKEINVIGGAYAEPNDMWSVKEYPELTDSTSIAAFGENSKKLDLPFTTDHRRAQRISKIQMKRLNAKRAFNADYWMRTISIQPGDIVTQTYARYGITSETFRVDFWSLEAREDRFANRRLVVPMRMVEEVQSWFDWDETTEEKPIDSGGLLPGMDGPRLTEVYYIKPITGTAIQNGVGTLTVEAHRIFAGVDELLSTGTIQLYEGTTLVTVANGYAAGSDGYTGVLDSGDISGSAIIELKDGPTGTILDTISLVDVLDGAGGGDGADAVHGSVEPENGLAWTRDTNSGPWTPSQLTTDLDCTFYQGGVAVARIARRVTLSSGDGTLTVSSVAHKGGDLNTSRVTVTVINSGTTAVTVQFDYSFGGDDTTVAETVSSSQGGDDGGTGPAGADAIHGVIEPSGGVSWTRAPNEGVWSPIATTTDLDCTFFQAGVAVARIARRITRTINGTFTASVTAHKDGDLNTSRVTVTVTGSASTAITVQYDYSFGGETASDAETVISSQGGNDAVYGIIEPSGGVAWTRATNQGAWDPTSTTTDLDCVFLQAGVAVARIARRITRAADGTFTAASTAHKDGDLNTGRVTVTVTGSGTTAITVQYDYSFGGQTASDAETVISSQGGDDGSDGSDGVFTFLTNEAHVLPANFDGTGYDLSGSGGTHKVFDGTIDKTTIATHSVVTPATKNGLTISVVAGTGVYSLSGASWTTDSETFILRANYNGVNYDKTYVIAKAKQGGDGGCALDTLTNISLSQIVSSGTATVGFEVNSDGDIYERPNNASGYSSKETWKGVCANTEYECRLDKTSGDDPSSGPALATWHATSTIRRWEATKSSPSGAVDFDGTLKIRRTSDNTVLNTKTVSLFARFAL